MLDLLAPFRSFAYYQRGQHGRTSIKNVLPALTGTDYSHLAIQHAQAAARAFTTAEFTDLSERDRACLRRDLLAYCALDTQAMIVLLESLPELTQP